MTLEEAQKFWDASLIKIWRNSGSLLDAVQLYHSLTGRNFDEFELLRLPPKHFPWYVSVKVFMDQRLPKINTWLWNHTPDKDVLLLRKLQTSQYDTAQKNLNYDADLKSAHYQIRKATKQLNFATEIYEARNHRTDWGVVKTPNPRRAR